MMDSVYMVGRNAPGTQEARHGERFLTAQYIPGVVRNRADAVQYPGIYLSNLLRMSPRRTPRALAILAQVKRVGMRWWLSIKLIAGRLRPVSSASLSWDSSFSLRSRASSSITLPTRISKALFPIWENNRALARAAKRNYSYTKGIIL